MDAGLFLQVDDAVLVHEDHSILSLGRVWSRITGAGPRSAVEALNHALRGIPEERTRYHVCWGSWNGPHVYDLPLSDAIGLRPRGAGRTTSWRWPTRAMSTSGSVWEDR